MSYIINHHHIQIHKTHNILINLLVIFFSSLCYFLYINDQTLMKLLPKPNKIHMHFNPKFLLLKNIKTIFLLHQNLRVNLQELIYELAFHQNYQVIFLLFVNWNFFVCLLLILLNLDKFELSKLIKNRCLFFEPWGRNNLFKAVNILYRLQVIIK